MTNVVALKKKFSDGLRNFVSGLGTSRDKASGAEHVVSDVTDVDLLTMYQASWLAQKIVDIPAFDACRRWRSWNSKSKSALLVEAEEKRLNVPGKVLEAMISARLFGGAALYINVPGIDPMAPLLPELVGKKGIKSLVVFPKGSLSYGEIDYDIDSLYFGKPKHWDINTGGMKNPVKVHPSRFVFFSGHKKPALSINSMFDWGDSSLVAVLSAIIQSDASTGNVASLLYEAKIDVLGIPGLMQNIDDEKYRQDLYARLNVAAIGKGNNGMFLKDIDETYEQKKMNFATIPEVMDRFFQNVAGAADIPMTRLFGMSPGGMNSTGDSDLKNYYDRIQSMQTLEMEPSMGVLDACLVRSALGSTPRVAVTYDWRSLWQSSEKEEAEISKLLSEALTNIKNMNVFSKEFLSALVQSVLTDRGAMVGLDDIVETLGADKILSEEPLNPPPPLAPGQVPKPTTNEVKP